MERIVERVEELEAMEAADRRSGVTAVLREGLRKVIGAFIELLLWWNIFLGGD